MRVASSRTEGTLQLPSAASAARTAVAVESGTREKRRVEPISTSRSTPVSGRAARIAGTKWALAQLTTYCASASAAASAAGSARSAIRHAISGGRPASRAGSRPTAIAVTFSSWSRRSSARPRIPVAAKTVTLVMRARLGEQGFGRDPVEPQILGDRSIGHGPAAHVQPPAQMLVGPECCLPALLGERQDEGQGRVVEGEGRGSRDGTRHVGDAIMDDAVLEICGFGMAGRARGLETAALIDGDID